MKSVKEVDSKKELSRKVCISQSLHVSKEEASAQITYLSGRALSVQEILKSTNLRCLYDKKGLKNQLLSIYNLVSCA